jgi:NRPS condensation-like uncharacterized protein
MYTREASALDLFTDSIRIMGDATLCAVMEFDTRLDPRTLEAAAQACISAHPVLHSRLVRGNGPAFWEMATPVGVPPILPEECADDYHPRVIGPVDPYGPLQVRVRLLRRSRGDCIVINLSHAAADAFGLHTLMSQLLQEYTKPGSIPPASGGIPERDTLWTRMLAREENPPLTEMKVIDPMWPDPFGTSREPSSFHRECISRDELDPIRARAKLLGGNINDVITAAYYLAMSDLTGHHGPFSLFFPVNLRQHLRDGSRVMSNQATNVCFLIERKAGEGMDEILPRVIREIKSLKQSAIGIAEQVAMDKNCDPEGRNIRDMVEQMASMEKRGLADIFFSNPGPLVLPEIPGLTGAYVCYPGGFMPTTCFITSTFRGQMTITMGYQDSKRAREGTRRAMELFRKHFLSLTTEG